MKTNKLRSLYIDYFKGQQHKAYPSDSLVPKNDPSVLFTGAGMNQFKPYFLGEKKDVKRATSCQKCLRTADLERVGTTAYHHTFFEMLGNFSFGDYFKEEAIAYGWDFVTRELGLPKEELWVSVFENDDEAFNIWKKKIGLDEKRIKRMSAADNFWPANAPEEGPNGPCGPCSEIYVGRIPGNGVEIWNLVFTQFDRQEGGLLKPLPQKNIDTGMGLERVAAVLQGVQSNYDTDLFVRLSDALSRVAGESVKPQNRRLRNAILDHIRAVTFCIADGVMPSNEGRGYVVRKLIRKSVLHLKDLGIIGPKLHGMVLPVVEVMKEAYPELSDRAHGIESIVKKEEEGFWNVLDTRIPQAEIKIKTIALTSPSTGSANVTKRVTEQAFEYYDTFGVPKEILKEIVTRNGLTLDDALFNRLTEEQRDRSRTMSGLSDSIFTKGDDHLFKENLPPTEFLGYKTLKSKARIIGLLSGDKEVERLEKGQKGFIVLDQSPFYAEQGGQMGDKGTVASEFGKAAVSDTQWQDRLTLHTAQVTEGVLRKGEAVEAEVEAPNRERIMKNHTATHLLHSALRKVLGPHVKQNGSLVAPDRLRFDFSHFNPMSPDEIRRVEDLVNGEIRKKIELTTKIMNTRDAISSGAIAFFGEKYGDSVRVVSVADFSTELCGGTHCKNTDQIGLFRIISEGSVQAGVRRIEAVTGDAAFQKKSEDEQELSALVNYLGSDKNSVTARIASGLREATEAQKKIKASFQKTLKGEMGKRLEKAPALAGGAKILVSELPEMSVDVLRDTADWLRSGKDTCAVVLSTRSGGKPQVVVALSKNLVTKGLDANVLVKDIAKRMEGSGGGRPDLAVGGGKTSEKLDEAIRFAQEQLKERLSS